MEHGEPIRIPQPPDQTPPISSGRGIEDTKINEAELTAQVGIAMQQLDFSQDAMDSRWMRESGKFTVYQAGIKLKALEAQAAGGLLTEGDLLNLEQLAVHLATTTPEEASQRGWSEVFEQSYQFLLDQGGSENALRIAQEIEGTLPLEADNIRDATAKKAIENGRGDLAARALEGVRDISLEDCLAIAKLQYEQGSLEQRWIDEAVKQAAVGTAPHRLEKQVKLAAFLHQIGRDVSHIIFQMRETLASDNDQWFEHERRMRWTVDLDTLPFDYVHRGRDIPIFRESIDHKLYTVIYLLDHDMVKPAEELASKDDFFSQCLIASYKAKNGVDFTPNLQRAHQLAEYHTNARQRATLVSLESRLGLMEQAEQTFQETKFGDDEFSTIVASAEIAKGYFKQGNQERARHYLDNALSHFQNAKNLSETATVRLALNLIPLLSEHAEDPTPVIAQALSQYRYFSPMELLVKTKELGLDVHPLLKLAEDTMRNKKEGSSSSSSLIELVKIHQRLGVPSDALLDELDALYDQLDTTHKRYVMDSLILRGICAKLDPQRKDRYYRQYFDTSEATIKQSDFRYNDFVDKAINEGAYKAALYAATLGKHPLPDIESKVFTAAIAAGDYPFAREVATASKNPMLQARMIAYDARANNDFSLADAWLTANAPFRQEDLRRKSQDVRFAGDLEGFTHTLHSFLDELDAAENLKRTAEIRIAAAHILLEGLRPNIETLDESQRQTLLQNARNASGSMEQVTEELTLLGLGADNLPWSEVRKAYNRTVRKMHPDSGEDYDPEFDTEMRKQGITISDVNEAFNELRKAYIKKGRYTPKR